jgi:NAD(P)-dependent dehydrogenase (short-subunit alcohol dehydrogenase family)
MSSYAITGASKGIGLEYVRQVAATSANLVLAIVRDPESPAIAKLASGKSNIHIVKGDVTDPKSLLDAARAVGAITGNKLDVLIHNSNAMDTATAYLSPSQIPLDVEATQAMFDLSFRTGIYGSLWTTNAFLPLIENGREKKIVYISTGMADLDLITAAGISYAVPYAVAKAGMNVQVAKYAVELKPKDIKVLALSPGWVDTWDGRWPPVSVEMIYTDTIASIRGETPGSDPGSQDHVTAVSESRAGA